MYGSTGEPKYSAPEMTQGTYYNNKIDVWSSGIVLFHMLSLGKDLIIQEESDNNTEI